MSFQITYIRDDRLLYSQTSLGCLYSFINLQITYLKTTKKMKLLCLEFHNLSIPWMRKNKVKIYGESMLSGKSLPSISHHPTKIKIPVSFYGKILIICVHTGCPSINNDKIQFGIWSSYLNLFKNVLFPIHCTSKYT